MAWRLDHLGLKMIHLVWNYPKRESSFIYTFDETDGCGCGQMKQ